MKQAFKEIASQAHWELPDWQENVDRAAGRVPGAALEPVQQSQAAWLRDNFTSLIAVRRISRLHAQASQNGYTRAAVTPGELLPRCDKGQFLWIMYEQLIRRATPITYGHYYEYSPVFHEPHFERMKKKPMDYRTSLLAKVPSDDLPANPAYPHTYVYAKNYFAAPLPCVDHAVGLPTYTVEQWLRGERQIVQPDHVHRVSTRESSDQLTVLSRIALAAVITPHKR